MRTTDESMNDALDEDIIADVHKEMPIIDYIAKHMSV